jgi:hypothetical protein
MRVNASGNVLINTTTDAGFRLDVNGSVRTTGSISAASAIARGTFLNQTLVATANNDVLVGLDIAPTFTAGAFTGVTSAALRVNGAIINLGSQPNIGSSANAFGTLVIRNVRSDVDLSLGAGYSATGENGLRMFSSTRNVVIQSGGTFTDAGFRLDVNGTTRLNGSATFGTIASNTGMLWDNTNNRLYLGTSSSTSNLDIRTTGDTEIRVGTITNYSTFQWNNSSGNTTINSYGSQNWPILFRQNNVERMRIALLGSVLIGTPTEIASSILTLASTTKGFLPPRMTTTERNAISSPATGLMVYDTTLNKLCVRTASSWETITSL